MSYAVVSQNQALDGITVDRVRLHSADAGVAGTSNALGAGLSNATFNAASSGERLLASDVTVTGLAANQAVAGYSLWVNSGTVFKGYFPITSGDTTANAAGEYTLKATTTKMTAT